MSKFITVDINQSIWDIAIQEYGDASGVKQLMIDNPFLGFTQSLQPGTKLKITGSVINQNVVNYLLTSGNKPSTAFIPPPVITVSPTTLSFSSLLIGQVSASQSVVVTGTDLLGNLVVTAPTGYIINTDNSNTNQSPLSFAPVDGEVNETVYVKFAPIGNVNYNNLTISLTSTNAITKTVTVNGVVTVPTISVAPNSLSFPNTYPGSISSSMSYVVSGSDLLAPIVITAPAGYIINTNNSSSNQSPISLSPVAGSVSATTIYVKFNPATDVSYIGNITHSSTSATTQNVALSGTGAYDTDAQAYFNQLTPQPSTAFKIAINTLVLTLKSDGNWARLDRLWIHGVESQQHARISLVNPTSTAITEVNSPAWTANFGYATNGSNQYLNTNYNASTNGVNYLLDSSSFGFYGNISGIALGYSMGCNDGTRRIQMGPRVNGQFYYAINTTTLSLPNNTVSQGSFAVARTGQNASQAYVNGSQIHSNTLTSSLRPNYNNYVGCENASGTAGSFNTLTQLSFSWFGGGTISQLALHNALHTFATTRGFSL